VYTRYSRQLAELRASAGEPDITQAGAPDTAGGEGDLALGNYWDESSIVQ
jgi:hypothetical protein